METGVTLNEPDTQDVEASVNETARKGTVEVTFEIETMEMGVTLNEPETLVVEATEVEAARKETVEVIETETMETGVTLNDPETLDVEVTVDEAARKGTVEVTFEMEMGVTLNEPDTLDIEATVDEAARKETIVEITTETMETGVTLNEPETLDVEATVVEAARKETVEVIETETIEMGVTLNEPETLDVEATFDEAVRKETVVEIETKTMETGVTLNERETQDVEATVNEAARNGTVEVTFEIETMETLDVEATMVEAARKETVEVIETKTVEMGVSVDEAETARKETVKVTLDTETIETGVTLNEPETLDVHVEATVDEAARKGTVEEIETETAETIITIYGVNEAGLTVDEAQEVATTMVEGRIVEDGGNGNGEQTMVQTGVLNARKGNLTTKVGTGKRRKYYRQGGKKRKYQVNVIEGEDVVFESSEHIFVGRGGIKNGDNSYKVSSENKSREFEISWSQYPKMLQDLKVNKDELDIGKTFLAVWQLHDDDFLELVPAQIISNHDTYSWMKPAATKHKGCIRVNHEDILKLNRNKHELHSAVPDISLDQGEVNVALLLLQATQTQLDELNDTYNNTLSQLKEKVKETDQLQQKVNKLNQLHAAALVTVKEYKTQLIHSQSLNQAANTLYKIIAQQKDTLDKQATQLIDCDRIIAELYEANQNQEKELKAALDRVHDLEKENKELKAHHQSCTTSTRQLKDLTNTIDNLEKENSNLKQQCHVLTTKHQCLFKLHKSQESDHVVVRSSTQKKRGTTLLPVTKPVQSSSNADAKTLKRRAEEVDKVLKAVSARTDPAEEDIICTLAAYLRKHPEIAIPACQSARITFSKELTTKEAVDLKVLLKLPMNRLRDLRRFLSNHNIKIFPSERPIYDELKARQSLSPEVVEIGIIQLEPAANSEPIGVAFARVKNLKEYLTDVINKQVQIGNTWTDEAFNDEIWLKVGGDKGGSSTKLVAQFVNQKNGCSADATNVLGMFHAQDTYANLTDVFSIYYTQLAELIRLKSIIVNGITKRLRVFLYGDYEFLCKYVGHMGPSSSYPCLWCNVTLAELRDNNTGIPHCPRLKDKAWAKNSNWAKERTSEQYVEDYANMNNERENSTRNITGHMFHSISKKPLFPLCDDMDHIIPPSLHILLGLVPRYYNLVELACRGLDVGTVNAEALQDNLEWEAASKEAKDAQTYYDEAKLALDSDQTLLKNFKRAQKGRDVTGPATDPCSMSICALSSSIPDHIDKNDVQWIRCTQCGKGQDQGWFHAYCVGIRETEIEHPKYNAWTCQICTGEVEGPESVIPYQEARVVANKTLVKDTEKAYKKSKKKLDDIFGKVAKERGVYEKKLNERLENDLKVKRQAYHSQCFIGNHCQKIVEESDTLLQDLPEGQMKTKFRGLFGRLAKILKLFKAEFLSPAEISELKTRCWEMGYFVPANFPEETIPPKLHMLICHVPDIAERWRTVGLLSEHGLESMHASINSIQRVYANVRDRRENIRLVLGSHQQRGMTSKQGLEVQPEKVRKCRGTKRCDGRYSNSLKEGKKVRMCKKCNHVLISFSETDSNNDASNCI